MSASVVRVHCPGHLWSAWYLQDGLYGSCPICGGGFEDYPSVMDAREQAVFDAIIRLFRFKKYKPNRPPAAGMAVLVKETPSRHWEMGFLDKNHEVGWELLFFDVSPLSAAGRRLVLREKKGEAVQAAVVQLGQPARPRP